MLVPGHEDSLPHQAHQVIFSFNGDRLTELGKASKRIVEPDQSTWGQ